MIYKATLRDAPALAGLAALLWEGHSAEEHLQDIAETIKKHDAAFFLCSVGGEAIGFAQCQLRHDYVEGTSSSPVGYLEGIFVKHGHRNKGHAKALLEKCEEWAKEQGCEEFASDCELGNEASIAFHMHMHFEEANRVVCFKKRI